MVDRALSVLLLLLSPALASASRPAPHLRGGGAAADGASLLGGGADDDGALAGAAARFLGLPPSFAWASAPEWGPAADVAVLNRTLTGGGFHRDLTYTLAVRGGLATRGGGNEKAGGGGGALSAAEAAAATATPSPPKLGRLFWRMAGFDKTPPASSACTLTVVQPLPPGLFADPYQLEGAVRAAQARRSRARRRRRRPTGGGGGGGKDGEGSDESDDGDGGGADADDAPDAFRLLGPLDLELPAPACLPTALVVQKRLTRAPSLRLRVPLHARYPAANVGGRAGGGGRTGGRGDVGVGGGTGGGGHGGDGGIGGAFTLSAALAALSNGHALVDVPPPLLALRCEGPQQGGDHARVWRPPRRLPPAGGALSWPVPAGSAEHLALVSWGTFLAAAGAAAVVTGVVWREAPRLGV